MANFQQLKKFKKKKSSGQTNTIPGYTTHKVLARLGSFCKLSANPIQLSHEEAARF
jgi:ribosomal protein S17E